MALVSLKELLNDSKRKKYGVFATNAFSFKMAETIIQAAEEKNSPVILMIAEGLFKYLNPEKVSCAILSLIKEAKPPIVFHLDHGRSIDAVMRCIKSGFNSIMFDCSMLSLDENIRIIKELKKLTNSLNICIEAEVGKVGGLEDNLDNNHLRDIDISDYTKVEDAVKFVDETDVDALAIAVGTIHGNFQSKPNLDFDRIREIRDSIRTPLVLHGSSGLSDEDFKKVINCGITKINYYSDLINLATKRLKEIIYKEEDFDYIILNEKIMEELKEKIKKMMDLFNSTNKG